MMTGTDALIALWPLFALLIVLGVIGALLCRSKVGIFAVIAVVITIIAHYG